MIISLQSNHDYPYLMRWSISKIRDVFQVDMERLNVNSIVNYFNDSIIPFAPIEGIRHGPVDTDSKP